MPVIAYFPLANGLLAGTYTAENLPKFPKSLTMKKYVVGGVDGYPEGGYTPLLMEMRAIAERRGKTVPFASTNSARACRKSEPSYHWSGAEGEAGEDEAIASANSLRMPSAASAGPTSPRGDKWFRDTSVQKTPIPVYSWRI